jgi:hypothetical protein
MSVIQHGSSTAIVTAAIAVTGSGGESGESTATPENPQAAIDAEAKLRGSVPNPKAAGRRGSTASRAK